MPARACSVRWVTRHAGGLPSGPAALFWADGYTLQVKARQVMKTLVWVIAAAALVVLIIGLTVQALGFLIGAAPVLLVVAIALLLLNRSRGRRIPH